jgi:heme-degrading monooxygenase HmoA
MNHSPVLLHVLSVRPEHESALIDRLGEMVRNVADAPGFVSARLLASGRLRARRRSAR